MQSKAIIILLLALVAFLAVKVSADQEWATITEWGPTKDCRDKGPNDCEECCDARPIAAEGSYYSYGQKECLCAFESDEYLDFEEAPYDPFRTY